MGFRNFNSGRQLSATVEQGVRVTLELTVRVELTLPAAISEEQEGANYERLMQSEVLQEVADELEATWRGRGEELFPKSGDPELGDPTLDIDSMETVKPPPVSPTPEAETAQGKGQAPPFTPHRRNSQVALTTHQQIVRHLEGPRFGFASDQREERLAFTAWLTEIPGLVLTSTNDLTPAAAQKVLKRLASEPAPLDLLDEWQRSRSAPEQAQDSPIYDKPLGF